LTILDKYKDFKDVFNKKNVDIFSEHYSYDNANDLQEGALPPFGPIYNLSFKKLVVLREHIEENLAKNFI